MKQHSIFSKRTSLRVLMLNATKIRGTCIIVFQTKAFVLYSQPSASSFPPVYSLNANVLTDKSHNISAHNRTERLVGVKTHSVLKFSPLCSLLTPKCQKGFVRSH